METPRSVHAGASPNRRGDASTPPYSSRHHQDDESQTESRANPTQIAVQLASNGCDPLEREDIGGFWLAADGCAASQCLVKCFRLFPLQGHPIRNNRQVDRRSMVGVVMLDRFKLSAAYTELRVKVRPAPLYICHW